MKLKMNEKLKTRLITFVFLFCMTAVLFPAMSVLAAKNGPDTSKNSSAFIKILNNPKNENDTSCLYSFKGSKTTTVKGLSYNLKTNTLTMNGFKGANKRIVANMMGDDFKIKVQGINEVGMITVLGNHYAGSLTITGNGKLTVNAGKKFYTSIGLAPELTPSKIVIDDQVTLLGNHMDEVPDGAIVIEMSTLASRGITIQNKAIKPLGNSTMNGVKVYFYSYGNLKGDLVVVGKSEINSVKPGKRSLTVNWRKNPYANGYQIQYSTNSKFKSGITTVTIKKSSVTKTTINKLQSGQSYYVRIRTYAKVKGQNVYSEWSKTKKAKAK